MSARRFFRRSYGVLAFSSAFVVACGWDPSRPFEREAPEVREAIAHLDAGDAQSAGDLLETYLATGACKEGSIGTPQRVRERSNGSFDLGLALFKLAERYGQRFGAEEADSGMTDPALVALRSEQVDCALKLVRAIATDTAQPVDLRARTRYLEGNLLFLNANYEEAVRVYEAALELAPGMHDSGPIAVSEAGRTYSPDLVGRDAAWNRAIALRRIDDKKDAGKDAASDAKSEGGEGGDGDGGGDKEDEKKLDQKDGGSDKQGDAAQQDSGAKDSGGEPDAAPPPKPTEPPDAGAPPPPTRQSQDERMLDQLENAPSVQHERARKAAQRRHVHGTADR